MTRFSKTASVIANPFHALDHLARPVCAVPLEPRADLEHLGYVGAKVDRVNTRVPRKSDDVRGMSLAGNRQDTVFAFSTDPVKVPQTPYYRDALRSKSLLPADKATATWAGIKDFVEPTQALQNAQAEAEADFDRQYGEGAVAELRGRVAAASVPETETASAPASGDRAPGTLLVENGETDARRQKTPKGDKS